MAVKAKEIDRSKLREYNIYAGLGGGYGGAKYQYTSLFESEEEAANESYYVAREEYTTYEGMRGLEDFSDAIEEARSMNPDLDDEELESIAEEIYNSYVEDWIEYYVVPTDEDSLDEEDLIRDYVIEDDNNSGETCSE